MSGGALRERINEVFVVNHGPSPAARLRGEGSERTQEVGVRLEKADNGCLSRLFYIE